MDTDVPIRAIVIGASITITLGVFTLVMLYYNQAKDTIAPAVEMSIDTTYIADIESALSGSKSGNKEITAIQVKNLLNYYYGSQKVVINVKNIKTMHAIKNSGGELVDNYQSITLNNANNPTGTNILKYKEIYFNIYPNSKYTVTSSQNNEGVVTYKIEFKS